MNEKNMEFAKSLVKPSYLTFGMNSLQARYQIVKEILTQRQIPEKGLDQLTIQLILDQLALMDSNNFQDKIGVGERESRIFSKMVEKRVFYMGHGIGRSGDVMANQPKAAGSSLMLQLTKHLCISAFKQLNYQFVKDVLLLPMATGMSLTLTFLTLASQHPQKKYVIWPRIDQKTCLKSIITANLTPIVIQEIIDGDSIKCDHEKVQETIKQIGADKILCVVSTTSCFAPRIPDDVSINSKIAKKYGIFHVVNNAYGLWCSKIASRIKEGFQNGQCTAVVQSTDKNFLVPVGGSIIFCQKPEFLSKISGKYPGRASAAPIMDLFITLLQMGKQSLRTLKKQHKEFYAYFLEETKNFCKKYGFRILQTKMNTISISIYLEGFQVEDPSELGSILYSKKVMGHRIVKKTEAKNTIGGLQFSNYGSHHENYPNLPYITFACAVGIQKQEINIFFKRFSQALKELNKKNLKKLKQKQTINQESQIKMQFVNEEKYQIEQVKQISEAEITKQVMKQKEQEQGLDVQK